MVKPCLNAFQIFINLNADGKLILDISNDLLSVALGSKPFKPTSRDLNAF